MKNKKTEVAPQGSASCGQKKCTKCKKLKSVSDFSKRNVSKGYLQSECKECKNKYKKEWGIKNRIHVLRYGRIWIKNNLEKYKKNKREWKLRNPQKRRESSKRKYRR